MATPQNPGQQPSPEQMAMMQQQFAAEAAKRGMTPQQYQAQQRKEIEEQAKKAGMPVEQYFQKLRQQAMENMQRQQQMMAQQQAQQGQGGQVEAQGQQQGQQQAQQVPINPGAVDPKAEALAKWLRNQNLKTRTCILNGQRKDMFKVKRALRALQSPAYEKASQKSGTLLPPFPTTPLAACETFKLLPLSLLALRVSKSDPHAGHDHAPSKPAKRVKGLWTVTIEKQQDINENLHYVWLYEGSQWKQKLYALGALLVVIAVIMFPLWPFQLRIGVWYLSMAFLGLIGLFFAMSIFRLILFCITVVSMPRGLWLYPNLFEDVGFFDSFRPVWGWQEDKKEKKAKKAPKAGKESGGKKAAKAVEAVSNADSRTAAAPNTTGAEPTANGNAVMKRTHAAPKVEEVVDE